MTSFFRFEDDNVTGRPLVSCIQGDDLGPVYRERGQTVDMSGVRLSSFMSQRGATVVCPARPRFTVDDAMLSHTGPTILHGPVLDLCR